MAARMPATGDLHEGNRIMTDWPDRRILDLLGIELPIIQAPMTSVTGAAMAAAVANAGGLGSLPCAMLSPDQIALELAAFRQQALKPANLNFFCHAPATIDPDRDAAWRARLRPYFVELGLDPEVPSPITNLPPFGETQCGLVEKLRPEIVSFHFGLPDKDFLRRIKAAGAKILSSATSVEEARWLEHNGCDAIIAQGSEAGGHRGMFLDTDIATQTGTFALVPQIVDAVDLPVIAAGGIADGRGIAAALALGASAVQLGTAYLLCPEATLSPMHRHALKSLQDDRTVITNLFTGRPARVLMNRIVRELGPLSTHVSAFPLAIGALAPLRAKAEPSGSDEFTPLWCGAAARLGRELPAGELTRQLADHAAALIPTILSPPSR
jgi:nitronate monooxygenase